MPSRSKTQQRLMGQAYAYKTGDLKAKDLNPDYADEIKKLSKSMTQKQLKDFAGTKHKGLPEKVEEKIKKFNSFNESFNDETPTLNIEDIESKIKDAAYSLRGFGTMTKNAAFINGAKWVIHNLTDAEINHLRKNSDSDDHSFFGL